jgi:hypothetical protein
MDYSEAMAGRIGHWFLLIGVRDYIPLSAKQFKLKGV